MFKFSCLYVYVSSCMQLMLKRALDNPKIKFLTNTTVQQWLGTDGVLSGAKLSNGTDNFEVRYLMCVCMKQHSTNSLLHLLISKSLCQSTYSITNTTFDLPFYQIECDGAFIAIGHRPNTKFLDQQVCILHFYILISILIYTNIINTYLCHHLFSSSNAHVILVVTFGFQRLHRPGVPYNDEYCRNLRMW